MKRLAVLGLVALVSSSCTSIRHPPVAVKVQATSSPTPLAAAVTEPAPHPEAVYRNPKIGVVYLRAHEDADGRLFGPQLVYQITEPGGWNVDSLDQSGAYIPSANLEMPADAAAPRIVPAQEAPPLPADAPMLDPAKAEKIVITGLMRKEDEAQAEAMARRDSEGRVAAFDSEAGWLLMPVTAPGRAPKPMSSELIYFAKANPIPGDPLSSPIFPFAYAETVRRVDGKLHAVNVQAAMPAWENGELRLQSFRLPDRDFCGFAYRVRTPAWFVRSPTESS